MLRGKEVVVHEVVRELSHLILEVSLGVVEVAMSHEMKMSVNSIPCMDVAKRIEKLFVCSRFSRARINCPSTADGQHQSGTFEIIAHFCIITMKRTITTNCAAAHCTHLTITIAAIDAGLRQRVVIQDASSLARGLKVRQVRVRAIHVVGKVCLC